jgi:methionyl-tRNA synthetase
MSDDATPTPTDVSVPDPARANTITFDDFKKVELRIGKVIEAGDHPNADKLIVLKVDLGDQQRQIIAGLKGYYTPEELMGKEITVVTNLAPRMMRGLESQGMLLAASSADRSKVVVLTPDAEIEPGASVG